MKRPTVSIKSIGSSPCGPIFEKILTVKKKWGSLQSSLRGCYVITDDHAEFALDPFSLLRVLAQICSDPQFISVIGQEAIRSVETWAETNAKAAILSFDEDMRKLCEEQSISIEGRFPSYTLDGFLAVKISVDEKVCTVCERDINSLFVRRIWLEIVSALKEERTRRVEPDVFLRRCYSAYRRTIAIRSAKPGAALPIRAVLREMVMEVQPDTFWRAPQRTQFVEYGEEYLRRDLSRLMESGPLVTADGAKMELTPTAFSKDGVSIRVGDGVRYVGHIAFVVGGND